MSINMQYIQWEMEQLENYEIEFFYLNQLVCRKYIEYIIYKNSLPKEFEYGLKFK